MATTNWIVITKDDVNAAFGSLFLDQDNQEDYDPAALSDVWIPAIVAMFRGAILNANRSGLGKTTGSVPPEAKAHVLVLVAEAIIVNAPRMKGYVLLQDANSPMSRMIIAARQFMKDLNMGLPVTTPTDLDPTTTPSGTQWGDDNGPGSDASVMTDLTVDSPPK